MPLPVKHYILERLIFPALPLKKMKAYARNNAPLLAIGPFWR